MVPERHKLILVLALFIWTRNNYSLAEGHYSYEDEDDKENSQNREDGISNENNNKTDEQQMKNKNNLNATNHSDKEMNSMLIVPLNSSLNKTTTEKVKISDAVITSILDKNTIKSTVSQIASVETKTTEATKIINNDTVKTQYLSSCTKIDEYVKECANEARILYDYTSKLPPRPLSFLDWCTAMNHITNCANTWNVKCTNKTNNLFSVDSLIGFPNILDSICSNDTYIAQYSDVLYCLEQTRNIWEVCYAAFKERLETEKQQPTNFAPLARMKFCCIHVSFTKCTSDIYLQDKSVCSKSDGETMQKFTSVVSQIDIFENCNKVTSKDCKNDPHFKKFSSRRSIPERSRSSLGSKTHLLSYFSILMLFFNTRYFE